MGQKPIEGSNPFVSAIFFSSGQPLVAAGFMCPCPSRRGFAAPQEEDCFDAKPALALILRRPKAVSKDEGGHPATPYPAHPLLANPHP